jgi:N-acyl-D-aspartate/D-glutamate deacylase
MYDLVIRNGTVVDGTGSPPRKADVAIAGGRIAAVGDVAGDAAETIDAGGLLVTPGFVDIHTHYDGQITWDPLLTPSCWHGVTTAVMGNCGVGFAPADPSRHEWLIGLMEGVEDIPGTALSEGMTWAWETFPEYLDYLDTLPKAIDVGTHVPHGAVRAYVMGERGAKNEPANEDDIAAMRRIVAEGIRAGALGVSTSRTIAHRAIDGVNVPGTFAAEDEMMALGGALADAGTGVFELAPAGVTGDDMSLPEKEVAWMRRVAAATGRPFTFALVQLDADPEHWRRVFELSEAAAADGAELHPQVTARAPGILVGLQTAHPWVMTPTYRAISGHYALGEGDAHHLRSVPIEEVAAEMARPATKATLMAELEESGRALSFISLRKVFPLGTDLDYEPESSSSVAALAEAAGRDPFELLYDLMIEDGGRRFFFAPVYNYSHFDYEAVRTMLTHPTGVFGLDDAGAHCGAICDASMPTFMLSHWARDRRRGERLPLEFLVKKITNDTATLYGLHDRGRLQPGLRADINVIDFDRLRVLAPELVHDLPAAGRRLIQRSDGYVATYVNGVLVMKDGEDTGARPGALIRGEQHP